MPAGGAPDEQTLAALKADAEKYRREAEAKQQAVEPKRRDVAKQRAKIQQIANGPAYDERSRQLDLAEEREKLDKMQQELLQLELAAEEAEYQAGQREAVYKQAWDAAHGIAPQEEKAPVEDQDLPGSEDLQRDDERRQNGILNEYELGQLEDAARNHQAEAERLRDAIRDAQREADQLDAQAGEIVDRPGYDDERRRRLDLNDVNVKLAQTEQKIRDMMQQVTEVTQRAEQLKREHEEAKQRADQYNQLQDEDFPDREVEPNDPNAQDPLAQALAEKETLTREAYEMARAHMIQIQTVIDLTEKKSPEQRSPEDIPLDDLQHELNGWRQELPGLKAAMEEAKAEVLEHREDLKKTYIRREITNTVREQLNKIMELHCKQDDPDDYGPKPITGLYVHANKLKAANGNRHGSQQWGGMFKALSGLNLITDQLSDLQRCLAMGALDYDGEQINSLRSQINLAAEQTQQYVDYKSGTFLVKLGIGHGPEYLREAQEALKYLRDIQTCFRTMDAEYTAAAEGANERYEPKAAAVRNDPQPQLGNPSLKRNATSAKNKDNASPVITSPVIK